MHESRGEEKPHPRAEKHDGDHHKHYPNSISRTVEAIVDWWDVHGGTLDDKRSLQMFGEGEFLDVYNAVREKFPGSRKATKQSNVCGMVGQVIRGNEELQFYKLYAFAEYIELPVGLLLIFTKAVSDERAASRAHSNDLHEGARDLASKIARFATALEHMATSTANGENLLIEATNDERGYQVRIDRLRELVDACK